MDTGSDFVRPEFLNILFFQQKNLVIFPYVDMKHLHTLEIFTTGYNVVSLESTALNNLKEIIEFESSNSYAQNPNLYFISNTGKDQLQQIMELDGIRCIINSNENISELANGSNFIFFNKKHGQFINYDINEEQLGFETELISSSESEEYLHEQIQKIKIAASRIFRDLNQSGSILNLPEILKDYDQQHWASILTFTEKYYDIVIPDIKTLHLKSTPKKSLKDFSEEYEKMVATNKAIGKEFIQLLHEYRHQKVNPQHLDLLELFDPCKLYNYLRNHHWKEGIPQDFISAWARMEISGYSLTESDQEDFNSILGKLGVQVHLTPSSPSQHNVSVEEPPLDISEPIPSLDTDWDQFKQWLMNRINNLEYNITSFLDKPSEEIANSLLSEVTSLVYTEISELNHLLSPFREEEVNELPLQNNHVLLNQSEKILLVDITNILNLDKNDNGKIKVSNIAKVHDAVLALGYTPKLWADASMRHHVDDKMQYEELLDRKVITQTPAGTKADIWVLKIAKQKNYKFLANDLYREYRKEFGVEWISNNRLTCVYDEGDFIILEKS